MLPCCTCTIGLCMVGFFFCLNQILYIQASVNKYRFLTMVPAWAELWFAWINLDLSGNSYLICAFMHNKFFGVLQCAVYEMIGMSDLIFLSRWYSRLHSRIMCGFQLIAVFHLWHDITKAHKLIACKISFLQVVGHSQNLGYVNYLLYHSWFLILWYKSSVDKKKPWNLWMLFQLVSLLLLSFNGQGTHLFFCLYEQKEAWNYECLWMLVLRVQTWQHATLCHSRYLQ